MDKEVQKQLREMFGEDAQIIDMKEIQRAHIKDHGIPVLPLNLAQAKFLLDGASWQPRIGDVVTLRENAPIPWLHDWPVMGEECVVTAIPDRPWISPHQGRGGAPLDTGTMILGFVHRCGAEDCEGENALSEYFYDHRFFKRVGSIWEGYEPKGRPTVPGL